MVRIHANLIEAQILEAIEIDYIDDSITSTMRYIDQQDNSEHAGRVAGDNILSGRLDTIEAKEATWDAKYSKPSTGISKTDLATNIQVSLEKADSAIQNIKTINGQSIIGTGNIDIQPGTNLPLSIVDGLLCITYNN